MPKRISYRFSTYGITEIYCGGKYCACYSELTRMLCLGIEEIAFNEYYIS